MDPTRPVPQRGDRPLGWSGSGSSQRHAGAAEQAGADGRPESPERADSAQWGTGSSGWAHTGPQADAGAVRPRRAAARVVVLLTLSLLLLWGAVTFGVAWYARDLSFEFFGWPFSFWVGAQGALLVYCAIVWTYARVMNRHEAAVAAAPAEPTQSEF